MSALADEPAIHRRLHSMSVETYHRLGESGVLGERTELLRGLVIDQMSKSPLHSSIVGLLYRHFLRILPSGYHPRAEQPLTFDESEPEPDLAVVTGAEADYFRTHPATAEIVVEVCVSSEDLDRLKLSIYAAAGVQECWLILAATRTVERYSDLHQGVYRQVEMVAAPRTLPSTILPGVILPLAGLFGK